MRKPLERTGVKLRGKRIEIGFYYDFGGGKERVREPLLRRPDETDVQSLDYGEAHRNKVLDAITIEERGGDKFDYAKFFPHSKRKKISGINVAGAILVSVAFLGDGKEPGEKGWFEETKANRSPRTNRKYKRGMKEFIERVSVNDPKKKWGELTIPQLTSGEILAWVEFSRRPKEHGGLGRSAKTVKNLIHILSGMFLRARVMRHEWGLPKDWVSPLIQLLPVVDTKKELENKRRHNIIDPFNFSEMLRIINAATGGPFSEHQFFIEWCFGCGPRPNESYGFAWEDTDLMAAKAVLKRGCVEKELSEDLKTLGSIRELSLDQLPMALNALKQQKARTFMDAAVDCDKYGALHFVFKNPLHDRPWIHDGEFRRNVWIPLLRRAGVRYRPPYQMRHTFAVLSLSAGDSEQWLAGVMGHVSTSMLQKHYAKNKFDKEVADLAARYGVRGFAAVWKKLQQEIAEKGYGALQRIA